MMMQFEASARQVVNAWINPRLADGTGLDENPVDTTGLFDLFDRYSTPTFYAGGGDQYAGSTRCCGSGTCDIRV